MPKLPKKPAVEEPSESLEGKSAWTKWPTLATIAKDAGVPRAKVMQAALRAGFAFRRCDDNTMRLRPAEADELKEELGSDGFIEANDLIKNASDLVASSVELVKTAQSQVKALLEAVVEPMKANTEASSELQRKALARVTELEGIVDTAREMREVMLNEQHERELARRRFEASEQRKDQAWAQVLKVMPALGPQLAATLAKWFGGSGTDVAKMTLAQELLNSLSKEQVLILTNPGLDLISDAQKETLRKLFGVQPAEPEPAPTSETAEKTPSS